MMHASVSTSADADIKWSTCICTSIKIIFENIKIRNRDH